MVRFTYTDATLMSHSLFLQIILQDDSISTIIIPQNKLYNNSVMKN
uniref:Uncharacterized protein n=1 Tax=Rhizophora mucronata TaxID=61149 RepID=A0A2P2R1Z0_RHIMU